MHVYELDDDSIGIFVLVLDKIIIS